MRFVIHVEGQGFLYKASHSDSYGGGGSYRVKYCDDVNQARIFSTLSAARNCKVAKLSGATVHRVEIRLSGNV